MYARLSYSSWSSLVAALLVVAIGNATSHRLLGYEAPTSPGVIATYTDADGRAVKRVEDRIQFSWPTRRPDFRLAAGPFHAQWSGSLFAEADGAYQFSLHVSGVSTLSIDGANILDATAESPNWVTSPPVELDYGAHTLAVSFRADSESPRMGLFWEGPGFAREPVPARFLTHAEDAQSIDQANRGQELVHAFRCVACHEITGFLPPSPAPSLANLHGNLNRSWTRSWLSPSAHSAIDEPHGVESQANDYSENERTDASRLRRMPDFGFTDDQADSLTAWLYEVDADARSARKTVTTGQATEADPSRGGDLFHTVGCLACHSRDGLGMVNPFSGGDLTEIVEKRPVAFFARWLRDPAAINAAHRMPVFPLSEQEIADLAAYLSAGNSANAAANADSGDTAPTKSESLAGRQLAIANNCAACHTLPRGGIETRVSGIPPLHAQSDWDRSCLDGPDPSIARPGYHLSDADAAAIKGFISTVPDGGPVSVSSAQLADLTLSERSCLNCHARDGSQGIARIVDELLVAQPQRSSRRALLSPPSLTGVGDKFHESALSAAISTDVGRRRPWLDIRMPRFRMDKEGLDALTHYFVERDRMPVNTPNDEDDAEYLVAAGSRLVTSTGFGCTSCHQVGSVAPTNVEVGAHGAALNHVGKSLRRSWFDRWVRNPSRMIPRMEMPSIQLPVPGVLDSDLDHQLAAVWHVLNRPDFEPPRPNPTRTVRRRNQPTTDERPVILTDVFESADRRFVKPLVIAFPNRHNVLFDLASNGLAQWWVGDAAHQRTRKKEWYWEPAGPLVVDLANPRGEFALQRGGAHLVPREKGQFVTELDVIEHHDDAVTVARRFSFAQASVESTTDRALFDTQVVATETWVPVDRTRDDTSSATGFARSIRVTGMRNGDSLTWSPLAGAKGRLSDDAKSVQVESLLGKVTLRITDPPSARFHKASTTGPQIILAADNSGAVAARVVYTASVPVDQFLAPELPTMQAETGMEQIVPGFFAQRLPISNEIMPTAFAWRADGTLIAASLKGRVWLVADTDDDGIPDHTNAYSEELAAPYGLAAFGDAVDVLTKYALLRLWDVDGDGRADRTETVASGWGHTQDYHDWAVGLERDADGNYYVALPCQQDDRAMAAARFRGAALRLTPRAPSPTDPRRYDVEVVARGLRFPMGMVLTRDNQWFVTDNQGNYNPFNELNHVQQGARYGFINRLEAKPDFQPPFESPAINIPHPWTRSVNGICILETPQSLRDRGITDHFGPFEDHLVGCDYDNRRLVRMSLDLVGGTYQGAIYPLGHLPDDPQQGFLGPVTCEVSPSGDLYVGDMLDSGWGGGSNIGAIVVLQPNGQFPFGIAEIRAMENGFTIDFTDRVDPIASRDPANYTLESYRRVSTPAYGGPDVDRRTESIASIAVSDDEKRVTIELDELRAGFVYELHCAAIGPNATRPDPAEGHYTLKVLPASNE